MTILFFVAYFKFYVHFCQLFSTVCPIANQIYLYLKLKHSSAVWKKDTKHFTDASIRNHITTNIAGHISSQLMAIDWKLFLHHSVVFSPPLHMNVHVCVSLCRADYDHCRVPRKRERQLKCEYFSKNLASILS